MIEAGFIYGRWAAVVLCRAEHHNGVSGMQLLLLRIVNDGVNQKRERACHNG
jgi:hypothetical protein